VASCLLLCCLTAGAPAPIGQIVLLAATPEYAARHEAEEVHVGTLERDPTPAGQPPRYRLAVLDPAVGTHYRRLHAPGKAHLLEPLAGKPVRVTGKLVRPRQDGRAIPALWVGSVQPLATGRPGADGVLARGFWVPEEGMRVGLRTFVFRDGTTLARSMKVSGPNAPRTASALLARRLGVASIDWTKQMVLCVCAGLGTSQLEVLRVRRDGNALVVSYRRTSDAQGGFAIAAQAVLVPRFAGAVRFHEAPAAARPAR
jgi:hypothetical protein